MKDTDILEIKRIISQGIEKSHPVPSPETRERLIKLENSVEKMGLEISEIKVHTTYIKEKFNDLPCVDHNERIQQTEREIDQLTGKAVVVGSVFGFIGAAILAVIGWLLSKIK